VAAGTRRVCGNSRDHAVRHRGLKAARTRTVLLAGELAAAAGALIAAAPTLFIAGLCRAAAAASNRLVPESAVGKRIMRAKRTLTEKQLAIALPPPAEVRATLVPHEPEV
jgi:predicted RNA polymerase sigma factor